MQYAILKIEFMFLVEKVGLALKNLILVKNGNLLLRLRKAGWKEGLPISEQHGSIFKTNREYCSCIIHKSHIYISGDDSTNIDIYKPETN